MKFRFQTRHLLAVTTIICLGFVAWEMFGVYVLWSAFRAKGELASDDWPFAVEQIIEQRDLDPSAVSVYHRGGFIDEEYLWRLEIDPATFDEVAVDLGLSADGAASSPTIFSTSQPKWWGAPDTSGFELFQSPNFSTRDRGPDGEHFYAAYDRDAHVLRVWHKSNF